MNRRKFMQAAGAFLAALGLGVKAKAREVVTSVGRGSPRTLDGFGATLEILDGDEWRDITGEMKKDCIVDVRGFIESEFENSMQGNSSGREPVGGLSADFIAHWKGEAWKHIETE